jgi:prolyl oligopeptidase
MRWRERGSPNPSRPTRRGGRCGDGASPPPKRSGLGASWRSEYGSACLPEELGWLPSYSPDHRVEDGAAYPATMFLVYETDARVDPLHARKMCAALQHSNATRISRTPTSGMARQRTAVARRSGADTLAFLAHHTGLTCASDP